MPRIAKREWLIRNHVLVHEGNGWSAYRAETGELSGMFYTRRDAVALAMQIYELPEEKGKSVSVLSSIQTGRQPRPRRTVLYGTHGVGKTTWAATWPRALLLPTEDGHADIDVDSIPLITQAMGVHSAAMELGSPGTSHEYQTLILDSADWLEQLIWKDVVLEANKPSIKCIDDIGYGKGHVAAAEKFRQVLAAFDGCRDAGMHVVVIAHCEIKRFESPEGDSYDRYMPKLHRQSAAILQEWADEVLFATYKTFTRKTDEGFGRERAVGVGTGERIIKTCERPGFLAKNRLGLPEELPLDFEAYKAYLPPLGNIAGAINNGSSKQPAAV